jgi:hypothetical protein
MVKVIDARRRTARGVFAAFDGGQAALGLVWRITHGSGVERL